ncbi:MAG: extracellular solute-binding protein, partial [Microcystaceae cyanobacterium]
QQAWQQWINWLKVAQAEPNVILITDTIALQKAFNRGHLAYLTCESSWIPDLREGLGADKGGVVLLPRGEQGPASPLLFSSTALFNRFASPDQTELALRFIQFLSNTEQQKKLITEKGVANISSNQRVVLDPRLYPIAGT